MYYRTGRRYYQGRHMPTTVTSKGQVTIPKPVRDYLGLEPGSAVEFELIEGRVIIAKVGSKRPVSRFERLLGCAGPGMSTEEIMEMSRGDG